MRLSEIPTHEPGLIIIHVYWNFIVHSLVSTELFNPLVLRRRVIVCPGLTWTVSICNLFSLVSYSKFGLFARKFT